jgi:hypothetical protein
MIPGRNDPCSCGSGKKYKHCCLRAAANSADSPEALSWRRMRRALDEFAGSAHDKGRWHDARRAARAVEWERSRDAMSGPNLILKNGALTSPRVSSRCWSTPPSRRFEMAMSAFHWARCRAGEPPSMRRSGGDLRPNAFKLAEDCGRGPKSAIVAANLPRLPRRDLWVLAASLR